MTVRPQVGSFGSVNIDRICHVDETTLAALEARYDWFPAPGETLTVGSIPTQLEAHITQTLLGGKGANQAVAAAHADVDSAFYGKVGYENKVEPQKELASHGVITNPIEVAAAPTGTAYVFVGPNGENRIALRPGANGAIDSRYVHTHLASLSEADVLLLQNEIPAAATESLLNALASQDDQPTVVLDPAPAENVGSLLGHTCIDIVTPNEAEASILAAELDAFDGVVCYKHGPDPIEVIGPNLAFEVAPPPADPVDTTGAGDVFAGYLGAELARGTTLRTAVHWGAIAGSLSVEQHGVQPAVPNRKEIEAVLS